MPVTEVLSIGPLVLWCGTGRRWTQRLRELARLRESYPSIGQLAERFGLTLQSDLEWTTIFHTRLDDGRPLSRDAYLVSPLGHIIDDIDASGGSGAGSTGEAPGR